MQKTDARGCVRFFGYRSYVFTGILFSVGPPGAPSFVARRKIGEKGVPRGCGPLNPRGNVLGHSDVLCACRFATVHLTRLSRLRRSAYPLASACCAAMEDRNPFATTRLPSSRNVGQLRKFPKFPPSLRGALVRRGNPFF